MSQANDPGITKERLRSLPQLPGVYLMKDASGEVLYVGKAKHLKNRVQTYFGGGDGRILIPYLLERVSSVETLVTEDERQAIILESDLIKKYKPRYNIRLKDDKAYLLVRINTNHPWPSIELVRQKREDGARYIGPFAFGYELRTLLEVIERTIPLRTCSDRTIFNRVRPCLQYQIKRCAGPCCLPVDKDIYADWVEQAVKILEGHTTEVVTSLEFDMERASEELRFEDAALIRDRIEVLRRVDKDRTQVQFGKSTTDAFGFYREGNNIEISVLRVRDGRLYEAKTFGFKDTGLPNEEVLATVLSQFYSAASYVPETVLLPIELEDAEVRADLLSEQAEERVKIEVPRRGHKGRLLGLSEKNAKENFEARFSDGSRSDRVLKALQVELGLHEIPRTIECVDVSHFQGGATVGAVVQFQETRPNKARYRLFRLAQDGKPDDFASMHELLTRHLSRGQEENVLPDLIIVDGGPPQLVQAMQVKRDLGLNTPFMIGLAKKRVLRTPRRAGPQSGTNVPKKPERVYVEGRPIPVILDSASEALHLLERIRDETHRVAITYHRRTRAKQVFRSALDNLPGVGKKRKGELLLAFGSVDKILSATPEEIAERAGFPLSLAKRTLMLMRRRKLGD